MLLMARHCSALHCRCCDPKEEAKVIWRHHKNVTTCMWLKHDAEVNPFLPFTYDLNCLNILYLNFILKTILYMYIVHLVIISKSLVTYWLNIKTSYFFEVTWGLYWILRWNSTGHFRPLKVLTACLLLNEFFHPNSLAESRSPPPPPLMSLQGNSLIDPYDTFLRSAQAFNRCDRIQILRNFRKVRPVLCYLLMDLYAL